MRKLAAIALGSNMQSAIGDRKGNLLEAIRRVGALGDVRAVSTFYDTEPVGYVAQPRFLNGAILVETDLTPIELMRGLLVVERAMGRERMGEVAKGPRVIDLDLLVYGRVMMATEELVLPHPAMHAREFVLEPLAEIAPELVYPVTGWGMEEMLKLLRSGGLRGYEWVLNGVTVIEEIKADKTNGLTPICTDDTD